MKTKTRFYLKVILASLMFGLMASFFLQTAHAAGLLTPSDGSLPPLTIKDHQVKVVIEDGYAITTIEQVFHNPYIRDLEAHYSFPIPEKASVSEFTMWIDGKPVTGEVLEKKKARQIYEEEKSAGRNSGLTERDSYKAFEIFVSPVRAGLDTRIRVAYIQPTHVDTGIGRYVYPLEEGGVDEEKLAFWTADKKVINHFSFDLNIRPAYPVDAVRVPNQSQAIVKKLTNGEWSVQMGSQTSSANITDEDRGTSRQALTGFNPQQNSVTYTLDKDLVVYWRHQEGLPGSVDLVTYKPDAQKRGTFMMVVTPGDDLQPITEGSDWIFILDISGSMNGKYATLADGIQRSLKKMRTNDRFRIVLFNNSARELTQGYVHATPDMIRYYSNEVSRVQPGNGTNLYAGLKKGLNALDADRTSAIVLVTDGVANVGERKQRKFIELIKQKDVRLFTFIMGNSANRPLLEPLTKASNGFAMNISNSDDIVGQILSAASKVTHEALHNVKINIRGLKTADMQPKTIGSLYRGQQLVTFGHYWGDGIAKVKLSGKISGMPKEYSTEFMFPETSNENPEIERLWAYAAIEDMTEEMADFGENPDMKQSIVDLGVEYALVTDYTSMLVVSDEVFVERGIDRRNKKRLEVEKSAQQHRASRPVQSRRVDQSKPMYRNPRPSHSSGGGALDPWSVLLLSTLLAILVYRRNRRQRRV